MTQVTVEEPRSVVEEVNKYKCDSCSHVVGEENAHFVKTVPVTHSGEMPPSWKFEGTAHLCDSCIEADSYVSYMDSVKKRESRMKIVANSLNKTLYIFPAAASITLFVGSAIFPMYFTENSLYETFLTLIPLLLGLFCIVTLVLLVLSKFSSVIK